MVPHNCCRNIQACPAGDSAAQSQFRIVPVCKEILVKTSGLFQHLAAVHRRAAIRPEHFLHAVVLAPVDLARTTSSILAIEVDQMPGLIDAPPVLINENLRRRHAHLRSAIESRRQGLQPAGIRLGVVVQQRNKFAFRSGKPLIVCCAEPNVAAITNQLYPEYIPAGVFLEHHFRGSVVRSIIHHHDIEGLLDLLCCQRSQARPQELAAVPIYDYNRNASASVRSQLVYYTGIGRVWTPLAIRSARRVTNSA